MKPGVRRGRTRLFVLILTLWALAVVGRLVQIQIAQGSRYRAKAQRQQERRIEIAGQRGSILDREGRELAVSVETSSLYAIPDDVKDVRAPLARSRACCRTRRRTRSSDGSRRRRASCGWIARSIRSSRTGCSR